MSGKVVTASVSTAKYATVDEFLANHSSWARRSWYDAA